MKTDLRLVAVARAKRIHRANYKQDPHGKCVLCGNAFQECPHSMQQVEGAVRALQDLEALADEY